MLAGFRCCMNCTPEAKGYHGFMNDATSFQDDAVCVGSWIRTLGAFGRAASLCRSFRAQVSVCRSGAMHNQAHLGPRFLSCHLAERRMSSQI